jgi:hypothetical protein
MPLLSGMCKKSDFMPSPKNESSHSSEPVIYQYDIGTGRNDKLDPLLTAS